MYDNEIEKLISKTAIFEKLYQDIRFVDPVAKKVLIYKDNIVHEIGTKCFDFWQKNMVCNNCISMRAYHENKTFMKVEHTPDKIFVVVAVPFELNNRRIVIELLSDATNSFIYEDLVNRNSSEVYTMIDNLNNLALRDPLTGIFNRRYINDKLPIDILNTALLEQEISVIMADIDFFKKVNDTYGHLAGDEVLKNFASALSGCMRRESDWVARFGGEEFLICLPGADLEKARETAEKMRSKVEADEIEWNGNKIKITSSFGICSARPAQGSSAESLIDAADKKLYTAKANGRNRVEY